MAEKWEARGEWLGADTAMIIVLSQSGAVAAAALSAVWRIVPGCPDLARLPVMPDGMAGVSDGSLNHLPVFFMPRLFGFQEEPSGPKMSALFSNAGEHSAGFLLHSVEGVASFDKDRARAVPALPFKAAVPPFVCGFGVFDGFGSAVPLLNMGELGRFASEGVRPRSLMDYA